MSTEKSQESQVPTAERSKQEALHNIIQNIHANKELRDLIPLIQDDLLYFLNAKGFALYYLSEDKSLVSQVVIGADVEPFTLFPSTSSIAGYVALSQQPLLIENVRDQDELHAIHKNLRLNKSIGQKYGFRSRSMIVVPIMADKVLLGVLQIANDSSGGAFSEYKLEKTMAIAALLGEKFRIDFHVSKAPFDWLITCGRLTKDELAKFSIRAKALHMSLAHFLLTEKKFSHEEIGESLERYYQKPYQAPDSNLKIQHGLIKKIKKSYLHNNVWVPVANDGDDEPFILIDDPTDTSRIMELEHFLNLERYNFRVATTETIRQLIGYHTTVPKFNASQPRVRSKGQHISIESNLDIDDDAKNVGAKAVRLVDQIIRDAINARASDIHIEPNLGRKMSTVRFRTDGICTRSLNVGADQHGKMISRIKIMSNLDISERRMPQDGKCVIRSQGIRYELRVATIPTVNGESVVMRILNSNKPLSIDALQLSEHNLEAIKNLLIQPHGIFLAVGPTGSGKTTTLHALLGHINTFERKIWTVEDPVEITQPGLQQVQVNRKAGLTFATALRSFLRADPDVIMVGEMRDQETAHIAVEASLTGHLVFSTLHTNSAAETITRLLDLGMNPINFSDALLGVLAQRLVRTLCQECKKKSKVTAIERAFLKAFNDANPQRKLDIDLETLELHHAVGCKYCNHTGYRGRIGIHELLVASPEVKACIYNRASISDIQHQVEQQGGHRLLDDGVQKVLAGDTDIEQLKRIVVT